MPKKRFEAPTWIAAGSIRGGSGISTFAEYLANKLNGRLVTSHARRSLANMWDEYYSLVKTGRKNDEAGIWRQYIHKVHAAFLKGIEELDALLAEYRVLDSSEEVLGRFNTTQASFPEVGGKNKGQVISVSFLNLLPDILRDYELVQAIERERYVPVADGKLSTLASTLALKRINEHPTLTYLKDLVPPQERNLQVVFTVTPEIGARRILRRDVSKGSITICYTHEGVTRTLSPQFMVDYLDGKVPPPSGISGPEFEKILQTYLEPILKRSKRRFTGDQQDFKTSLGIDFPAAVVTPAANKFVQDTSYLNPEEARQAAIQGMNKRLPGFATYLFSL
jgi:hypothetical protein